MNPIRSRDHSEDDIGSLIESKTWDCLIEQMFREKLTGWKKSLLTNQGLDDSKRNGYILARQTILQAFQVQYKKYNVELPLWLEE